MQTLYPFIIHVLTEDSLQKGCIIRGGNQQKAIYTSDSVNICYIHQYPLLKKFDFTVSDKWGMNRHDGAILNLRKRKLIIHE